MAGSNGAIDRGSMAEFQENVRGRILQPGDADYDASRRIWNGVIDRRPALIVQCTGTADVVAAVNFARANKIPLAVRGGGHNVAGNALCDDGVVIDLSRMRRVRVDPVNNTARVDGGAVLGDVDHEAQAFGLAVPVGVVSATGIAGLALHGGMGFLTRKYGLTCDHILSADVVTADGRVVVADAQNNPDLLWALRGGGGSFGVVTSFEFKLRPVGPDVWMCIVMYPVAEATNALQTWRKFMETAPEEIMSIAIYWNAPHDEPVPKQHQGSPVIVLAGCWSGPVEQGEAAFKPLREIAAPVADLSGPMPYQSAQKLFDPEYPDGRRYYWKSIYLKEISDSVIHMLNNHAASRPSQLTSIDLWCLGGAIGRVKPSESAFFKRDAPYMLGIESNWEDPKDDEANISWTRNLYRDAEKYSPGGMYFNFPGFLEEGDDLLKQSFGTNYDRLRQVKAKYDPQNLFSYNLNISGKA